MTTFGRGEFRIDVRMGGDPDLLRVQLIAPDGTVVHDHAERVAEEAATRAVYQALMTAMACAIREDCRSLTVDFAPAGLLALVHEEAAARLAPLERNLQRWLLSQLELFDHVWMHGRPLRHGVLPAASAEAALDRRLFRAGRA